MAVRAVVFDLDGTLVETAPDLHAILGELLQDKGCEAPTLAAVRAMVGDGARSLIQRAMAWQGLAIDAQTLDAWYRDFLARYEARPARHSRLYHGVADTLAALRARGLKLAVCTNKPQRPSELLLEALALRPLLDAIVGGDRLAVRKPDPRHLEATLSALGVPAGDSIMVGDSANDVAVARGLGLPCVLVSFGYTTVPAHELGADRVIDRFDELLGAIDLLALTRRATAP